MKVVEFRTRRATVGVGVGQVTRVEVLDDDECTIYLAGGDDVVVRGTLTDVLAKLNAE